MLRTVWLKRGTYSIAQVDVYSGVAFRWAEAVCWLLRKLRVHYVLTLHGGLLPEFERKNARRVLNLLKSAEVVTTPSRHIQEALRHARSDILYLPNAVELGQNTAFRLRSEPRPRLAWLRAFHKTYSPETAVYALKYLLEEFSEVKLVMFGPDKRDGSLEAALESAARIGVLEHLEVAGSIPKVDVPQHLADFDIFLNTTTAESFGVSVIEAGALGMCIVTTNVGELPRIWTHEHDALLVPPNDPIATAAAVRRILTEPNLAARLSRNARVTATQFDWSLILPRWHVLLSDIVERRHRNV